MRQRTVFFCVTVLALASLTLAAQQVNLSAVLGRSVFVNDQACANGFYDTSNIGKNQFTGSVKTSSMFKPHIFAIKKLYPVGQPSEREVLNVSLLFVSAPGLVYLKCRLQRGTSQNLGVLKRDAQKRMALILFINDKLIDNLVLRASSLEIGIVQEDEKPPKEVFFKPIGRSKLAETVSLGDLDSITDTLSDLTKVFLTSASQVDDPEIQQMLSGFEPTADNSYGVFTLPDLYPDLHRFNAFSTFGDLTPSPHAKLVLQVKTRSGLYQNTVVVNAP